MVALAAVVLSGTAALSQSFEDKVVSMMRDLGYTFVEVKRGPTQLKAEGVKGTEKLEVIYDLATGRILKREQERADADEIGRVGFQFDVRDRDFLDAGDDDDRNDDDGGRGRGNDDGHNDHDDNSGSGSHNSGSGSSNSGSGSSKSGSGSGSSGSGKSGSGSGDD